MDHRLCALAGLAGLTLSLSACAQATPPAWVVASHEEWNANADERDGLTLEEGLLSPTDRSGVYTSVIKRFDEATRIDSITLTQSPLWHNWEPIENLGPNNMQDAPVVLSLGEGNYWAFGRYGNANQLNNFDAQPAELEGFDVPLLTTPFPNQFNAPGGLSRGNGGYHAWQSTDMVNWVHHGPVTEGFSRWVTSAEYADGRVYIFYDYPNDQDPHVYVDEDLFDGVPGENLGIAFEDPSDGSDAGFIRDLDGNFHVIYEDWSPINARQHSWDSPLAGHAVSDNGPVGYTIVDPAVDNRTTPTGETATYNHPHWRQHPDWDSNVATYQVHSPEQEAYGDWAVIAIGGQTYLFGDYDPVDGHMSVCWFTSSDINQEFTWCGHMGSGHPDPDVCFAEGRFYLFTQQQTDWVSDGPWVPGVEVRVGVDTTNDGTANVWSEWETVSESYDHTEGFAKQIAVTPASLDLSDLHEGFGFQFEIRLTDATDNESKPMIDRVQIDFR